MESNGEISTQNLSIQKMDFHGISTLADEFVLQYYTVMNHDPEELHRFYGDDSSLIFESDPVFGQENIHNVFMKSKLKNTKVFIHKVDALRSNSNCVNIQVSGELSNNSCTPRRFMRSFTLCETSHLSFYVLNDIFRYQDKVFLPEEVGQITKTNVTKVKNNPVAEKTEDKVSTTNNSIQNETWTPQPEIKEELKSQHKTDKPVAVKIISPPSQLIVEEQVPHLVNEVQHSNITPPSCPPFSSKMSWAERASAQSKVISIPQPVNQTNLVPKVEPAAQNQPPARNPRNTVNPNQNRNRGPRNFQQEATANGDNEQDYIRLVSQANTRYSNGPIRGSGNSRGNVTHPSNARRK